MKVFLQSIAFLLLAPLGTLAAYLLEPESDDGLTSWNFVDGYLDQGKVHPVHKIMSDFKAASRSLK